jgi:hypothetical protein
MGVTSERIAMPPSDDNAVVSAAPDEPTHQPPSRRSVLRGAAGAGVAGLAMTALAVSPAAAASSMARARPAPEDHEVPEHVADGEPVVVHVRNVRSGEMDIYHGTSQVRVHDRALAVRLARASR